MIDYHIRKESIDFLSALKKNNHKPWFEEHRHQYEASHKNMIAFAEELMDRMSEYDHLVKMTGKKSLFRIYRDVRFSKDKSPYKGHWSGRMKRESSALRGGYYYHVEPGDKTIIAGGFWNPNPADLFRIRKEIEMDDQPLREIIKDPLFIEMFGTLHGDGVKTAPKGFDKNHAAIDLIRMKQFLVHRSFKDSEVLSVSFMDEVVATFQAMRPFFDYMSDVLTTNLDGEPLQLDD